MINTIAIVGGGISGTLTVLNCIKQSQSPLKIIWFDANNQFCKGLAYSSSEELHLLNVRANNMSLFVDEPNHFVDWLKYLHPHFSDLDFVPRKIFGEYIQYTYDKLKNANSLVSIIQVIEEVIDIKKNSNEFEVITTQTYQVQKLVLAFGNFLPAHPRSISQEFIDSENYFQNAFHSNLVKQIASKKHLTIIGSGLTMIDVVMSLYHHHFSGKITIISPHAYIPESHHQNPLPGIKPFIEEKKTYSLLALLSLVNQQLKEAKKYALNLHSVIDVMRPHLQFIWLNFTLSEKQQFLRHLRHKWGVARHRAPNQSMAIFKQLQSSGVINLVKGKIADIKTIENTFEIHYINSNINQNFIKTEFIINCTGPQSNYLQIPSILVQNLIKNQILMPDSINYGLKSDENGKIAANIFTLGPPLKGILWESTAVPEIRLQAKELATKIICN